MQKTKISDLIEFFNKVELKDLVKIDSCTTVLNGRDFIESHIIILKNNPGNKTFLPYYDRLIKYKKALENG